MVVAIMTGIKAQQQLVKEWNSSHPIGTPVTWHKRVFPLRDPVQSKTWSSAWLMGGHTAMVMVEGVAGGVMLESVVVEGAEP